MKSAEDRSRERYPGGCFCHPTHIRSCGFCVDVDRFRVTQRDTLESAVATLWAAPKYQTHRAMEENEKILRALMPPKPEERVEAKVPPYCALCGADLVDGVPVTTIMELGRERKAHKDCADKIPDFFCKCGHRRPAHVTITGGCMGANCLCTGFERQEL